MTAVARARLAAWAGSLVSTRSRGAGRVGEAAHPRLTYRPDLDGLRAIAIGLVIFGHVFRAQGEAAAVGVTVFFVLSGYLITSILVREERVDLRAFYRRRIRRLAPAFLVMLAGVGILAVLGVFGAGWQGKWLASVFYITNWPLAFDASSAGPTDHAWSLAIEEQFYLSWPLVLAILPRWRVQVALAGIAVGVLTRHFAPTEALAYYATFARMDGLLLGCLAALLSWRLPNRAGWLGMMVIALVSASSLTAAPLTTFAELGGLAVVLARLPLGVLAPIGRRAYSLYLWTCPLALLGPLGTVAGIAIAELSYRFVERPFLRSATSDAAEAHPQLASVGGVR